MNEKLNNVIVHEFNLLMSTIQMGISYEQWSNEYSYEEILRRYSKIKEKLKELLGDITKLDVSQLEQLGFKKWDNESGLYLIPLWIYNLIPDGTELVSINNTKVIKGIDPIDLDVRFGCISFGIKI